MRALLASLAVLAIAFAGCSDDPGTGASDGDGGGAGTASQSSTGTAGPTAAESAEVMAMNNQFSPREVTVKVGGSVRWVTHDSLNRHNVVSSSEGNEFRSPDMDAALPAHDTEFTHAFQSPGTVDYVCEYHSGMVGKVFVVE